MRIKVSWYKGNRSIVSWLRAGDGHRVRRPGEKPFGSSEDEEVIVVGGEIISGGLSLKNAPEEMDLSKEVAMDITSEVPWKSIR